METLLFFGMERLSHVVITTIRRIINSGISAKTIFLKYGIMKNTDRQEGILKPEKKEKKI
jgi:hypothetical protein